MLCSFIDGWMACETARIDKVGSEEKIGIMEEAEVVVVVAVVIGLRSRNDFDLVRNGFRTER
jgi:hypothetical protein